MCRCATQLILFLVAFSASFFCLEGADFLGVGAPIVDVLILVDEAFIDTLPVNKGDACVVTHDVIRSIISYGKEHGKITLKTGGSASNTLKGLAKLGHSCTLIGKIGDDDMGTLFLENILKAGVHPLFLTSHTPTALVASLITPDGERTMPAYPGASIEMKGKDLLRSHFKGRSLAHIEGYAFYNDSLVKEATSFAKNRGILVSLDMGCASVAHDYREEIIDLMSSSLIDIAFANEDEAYALTGETCMEKACQKIHSWVPVAIVLCGKKGCWVGYRGEALFCPTTPIDPVDNTGAGDLFAAGFLHGYLQGLPIETCAQYGHVLGGIVVQHVGAEIPEERWSEIRDQLDFTVEKITPSSRSWST